MNQNLANSPLTKSEFELTISSSMYKIVKEHNDIVVIKRHLDDWYMYARYPNFSGYTNIIQIQGFSFDTHYDFDIMFFKMYK